MKANTIVERLDLAITVMKRAGNKIGMADWQYTDTAHIISKTEKELHGCGNTACFAGYLAISPEFNKLGLRAGKRGQPYYDSADKSFGTQYAVDAISNVLGITHIEATSLVAGDVVYDDSEDVVWGGPSSQARSQFYGKYWGDVTAEDVIVELESIKQSYMQ